MQGFVDELPYIHIRWPHCLRCKAPLAEVAMRGFCDECRGDIWDKARSFGDVNVSERVLAEMRKWGYAETQAQSDAGYEADVYC